MQDPAYQPRVTVYVRSLCPRGAHRKQDRILERPEDMADAGHVAGVSVTIWGDRVPQDGRTAVDRAVLERIERFEAWSDRARTSLAPSFETAETGSMLGEETRPTVAMPVVCLAEHHQGTLQYVTPCVDGGTVRTVSDRLDAIEGGDSDVRRENQLSR